MKAKFIFLFFLTTSPMTYSQTGNYSLIKPSSSNKLLLEGNNNYVEAKSRSGTYGLIVREYNSGDYGNIEVTSKGLGLGYLTSGAHLQIAPGGNIGIGTSSPGSKLQVNGETRLRGTNRTTHFNYSSAEHTYIRGGKSNSNVYINDNGGMVGVGTTSPQAALHVRGDFNNGSEKSALLVEGNPGQHASMVIKSPNQNFVSQVELKNGSNGKYWTFGARNSFANGNNRFAFYHYNGSSWKNPLNLMADGNIGVGTDSPKAGLHIKGDFGNGSEQAALMVEGNPGNHASTIIKSPDQNHVSQVEFRNGSNNKVWTISSRNNFGNASNRLSVYHYNGSSWKNPLTILDNGNVGIKTSNPQSLLAVNGTITAKEIEVTIHGWSDYVFADDYQLPSLNQVESFIKKNKHLPNIPSEKEVCENGIELGEMNSLLLGKIEELTLYLIEQEKVIKALKLNSENQQKAIKDLNGQITDLKNNSTK